MGGGEVARYVAREGESGCTAWSSRRRCRRTCTRPATTRTDRCPRTAGHEDDRRPPPPTSTSFFDDFMTDFFSAGGASWSRRSSARRRWPCRAGRPRPPRWSAWPRSGSPTSATTSPTVTVPTLVIHGDSDATVPFEGSGARTHAAIPGSRLHVVADGPHGINVSHAAEFNQRPRSTSWGRASSGLPRSDRTHQTRGAQRTEFRALRSCVGPTVRCAPIRWDAQGRVDAGSGDWPGRFGLPTRRRDTHTVGGWTTGTSATAGSRSRRSPTATG